MYVLARVKNFRFTSRNVAGETIVAIISQGVLYPYGISRRDSERLLSLLVEVTASFGGLWIYVSHMLSI
ncbi:hypothetical protein J6590_099095 [Homalodisca vitripennis]|nr:hypothetical protein J6590_099095 [Homalodisca vitripennis]